MQQQRKREFRKHPNYEAVVSKVRLEAIQMRQVASLRRNNYTSLQTTQNLRIEQAPLDMKRAEENLLKVQRKVLIS